MTIRIVAAFSLFLSLPLLAGEGKIRVFVTDSTSWEVSGGVLADEDGVVGGRSGGARPQTAEVMKTFRERCPSVTVTRYEDTADYVVVLEHEGGKRFFRRDNKVAVFNREGDMIHAGSTRILGNAVKDACQAILEDAE